MTCRALRGLGRHEPRERRLLAHPRAGAGRKSREGTSRRKRNSGGHLGKEERGIERIRARLSPLVSDIATQHPQPGAH